MSRRGFFIAALLNLCALALWHFFLMPDFDEVWVSRDIKSEPNSLPVIFKSYTSDRVVVIAKFVATPFTARRYQVRADDCLISFVVNGEGVPSLPLPFCDWGKSNQVDLEYHIQSGRNVIVAFLTNEGVGPGGFYFSPSNSDSRIIAFRLYAAAVVLFICIGLVALLRLQTAVRWCLIGGLLLRLFYFFITPPEIRSYDFHGHLEYIRFIDSNWTLPPPDGGWEFYQPPLYYLLTGLISFSGEILGLSYEQTRSNLQIFSLFLSIATLYVALRIGQHFVQNTKFAGALLPYSILIATLPGLVFSASRITNDTLFHLLSFIWCWVILVWWRSVNNKQWWAQVLLIVLMWLTKATAAPLIATAFVLGILRKGIPMRKKFGLLSGLVVAVILSAFALQVLRAGGQINLEFHTNFHALNPALQVQNSAAEYLTFNPLALFEIPFNHTWHDESRRANVFEFFFRSIFFGEFQHSPNTEGIAQILIVLGLINIVAIFFGGLVLTRYGLEGASPLFLILCSLIGALLAFRVSVPYSCNQDFRFIHLVAVPLALSAALATQLKCGLRAIFSVTIYLQALAQIIFLLLLGMS